MSTTKKKNILVLGGAGFLGSHLCERLIQDCHVICVDNFISSAEANISALLRQPDFEFIRHDMTEPLDLTQYPELARFNIEVKGIQEIYNLACPTSVKNFEKYKMQTLLTNSHGTKNGLDLAVKYKAKFLHASSAVVYGPRTEESRVFKEEEWGRVNLLSPRACYDEGKRFAESMVMTYKYVHGLDVKIVRVFRTYGPRMPIFDGQMISDFIIDALDNKDLVIYGDKSFTTTLCYVTDVVDGMMKMMASEESGPANIGGDKDVPIAEVAEEIIEMIGSKSKVVFQKPLLFMTELGIPDIDFAKNKLDWFPVVLLEEGLKKSIDYAKAEKSTVQFGSEN